MSWTVSEKNPFVFGSSYCLLCLVFTFQSIVLPVVRVLFIHLIDILWLELVSVCCLSDSGEGRTPPAVDVDHMSLAWDQPIDPDQDQVVLMVSKIISQGSGDPTLLPAFVQLSFFYFGQFIVINITLNGNIGTIPVYANGTMLKEQSENQVTGRRVFSTECKSLYRESL